MQPRIAIPVPTSRNPAYNRENWPVYAEAVRSSGGDPVSVPLDLPHADLAALCRTIDGLLLPGSPADVNPGLYGHPRDEASAPADPQRETIDRLLLEQAEIEHRPVLAICFGMQMLNVIQGGTLIQDLGVLPVNHAACRGVAIAHDVAVDHDSVLGRLLAADEASVQDGHLHLPVNSSHHQAVGIVGQRLVAVARCPSDRVVEAVEGICHSRFVVGVQWHPERTFGSSPVSRALFARLILEAARSR